MIRWGTVVQVSGEWRMVSGPRAYRLLKRANGPKRDSSHLEENITRSIQFILELDSCRTVQEPRTKRITGTELEQSRFDDSFAETDS